MAELVITERRDDGVAVVTLDNPKANALSTALLNRLAEVAADLTADPPGAVVITGGPKIFAAGADIGEFGGPEEAARIGAAFRSALDAVAAIPRPTIAAVNGYALGGGCELTLACDMRIAHTGATFGQPEVLLGVIPGGGGTQRLARLIGPARAKAMIFTGCQIKAPHGYEIGLVDELADDDATATAIERAAAMAAGPSLALAMAKRAIDEGLDGALEAGLDLEQKLFTEVFATEDSQTGIASFRESGPGKAVFQGR